MAWSPAYGKIVNKCQPLLLLLLLITQPNIHEFFSINCCIQLFDLLLHIRELSLFYALNKTKSLKFREVS